jgi:hypothetical protein
MNGDPPADAGLGVIVEDDRERCGRHGDSRRRTPKPGAERARAAERSEAACAALAPPRKLRQAAGESLISRKRGG